MKCRIGFCVVWFLLICVTASACNPQKPETTEEISFPTITPEINTDGLTTHTIEASTSTPTLAPPTPTPTPDLAMIAGLMSQVARGQGVADAGVYDPYAPGPHPFVILGPSGEMHSFNDDLPIEWQPKTVSETELVVTVEIREDVFDGQNYGTSDGIVLFTIFSYQWSMYVQARLARSGEILMAATLRGSEPQPFPETATSDMAPVGSSVGYGDLENWLQTWLMCDGRAVCLKPLRMLEGHTRDVQSVAFSPDGQTLVSGSVDQTVRMWRVSDGALLHKLEGHTDPVYGVAFSPDGQTLASGSMDQTVRLWRVSDGELLRKLEGHTGGVISVAFSPDGQTLATGSEDNTVRLWRVSDGALLYKLFTTDGVISVAFSPDGQMLASGSLDNTVRLWRVSNGFLLRTLWGHTDPVTCVTFSPDGQMLASGSIDNTVRLWRVADGALLNTLEGHTFIVLAVVFSPDGQKLVSGSFDNTERLWRVSDGALLSTLRFADAIVSLAFSPDGQTLASGSTNGTVRLWLVVDGE